MDISTKQNILVATEAAFNELLDWLDEQVDEKFEFTEGEGKWSVAQHVDHLVRSTKPLNMGLGLPKPALRLLFGKPKHPERSYDKLVSYYESQLDGGAVATGRYVPGEFNRKDRKPLTHALMNERNKLLDNIGQWKEEQLSSYQLPHPLIGKITVREMLFFTIYHMNYHTQILKQRY